MYTIDLYYVAFLLEQREHFRQKVNMAAASIVKCDFIKHDSAKAKEYWKTILEWANNDLKQTELEIEFYADQVWQHDKPYLKF